MDIGVLFVGSVKAKPQCCCVIIVREVGIWHVFGRHWSNSLKEVGFVHDARNDHFVHLGQEVDGGHANVATCYVVK